uniref:type IV pilin-like G/H family protein n=1 Tax=Trichocoleus desertorum TaxID=1481672 RepID=UPI0025B4A975|nr:type IV pilin-like G/H family protein [Trichocoleus desertorum]
MWAKVRTKQLQNFLQAQQSQGFTLWEGLVILVILGAMAAIALPSVISCGGKAVNAEAKQFVGALNRAQQAYYRDNNRFSRDVPTLRLEMSQQTNNFTYSTLATSKAVFNYGLARRNYVYRQQQFGPFRWEQRTENRPKSYVGAVFLAPLPTKATPSETKLISIVCEANLPGITRPTRPTYQAGVLACGNDTREIFNSQKEPR